MMPRQWIAYLTVGDREPNSTKPQWIMACRRCRPPPHLPEVTLKALRKGRDGIQVTRWIKPEDSFCLEVKCSEIVRSSDWPVIGYTMRCESEPTRLSLFLWTCSIWKSTSSLRLVLLFPMASYFFEGDDSACTLSAPRVRRERERSVPFGGRLVPISDFTYI